MKEEILKQLSQIENTYNVKILYACESGSRGWGFASTDSDYDVRFIYVQKESKYLQIYEERDVIELPLTEVLDINGLDLKKTLILFRKSNPTLFEWLESPIVYLKDEEFHSEILELANKFIQPKHCLFHYLSTAKRNFNDYLDEEEVILKKYFYVLRPILACEWILKYKTMAPMLFEELLPLVKESDLKLEIYKLLDAKRQSTESDLSKPITVIHNYLQSEISKFEELLKNYPQENDTDVEILNKVFRKYIKKYNN